MMETLRRYLLVTKPWVVLGNLVSVAGGFLLAARGLVDVNLLLGAMAGTGLVIASGCVFNNCIDRDIDRKMARTRDRVLARRLMTPGAAVTYAALLGIIGMGLLWATVSALCVAIAASGLGIYVVIYSLLLKRRSVHGTLIGSLAGAVPPLVGYCAAAGRFDTGALILLAIFSMWQMPHAFAIAVARLDDYKAAAIPVLPVQRGVPATKQQTAFYILAFTAAALALGFGGYVGPRYLAAVVSIGLIWLTIACWGYRGGETRRWARRLFVFSILNITVLCAMMAVDATMPQTPPRSKQSPQAGIAAGPESPRPPLRLSSLAAKAVRWHEAIITSVASEEAHRSR